MSIMAERFLEDGLGKRWLVPGPAQTMTSVKSGRAMSCIHASLDASLSLLEVEAVHEAYFLLEIGSRMLVLIGCVHVLILVSTQFDHRQR